ncbi:MAG: DUF1015 domain-containing protein [Flavobacteriales bacterium]|nr:DUF1015 domain-containing protein [Flavobacteriales bacterium]
MAKIIPFRAIRPTRDKAYLVSTLPFYAYKKNVLVAKLESNPYTFLHVINPEFRKDNKTQPNTVERFEKVKEKFDEFRNQGIFTQDEKPYYYIHKQKTPTHTFIGIIAGIAVDDYINGSIKIHEHTLTQREETFKLYLDVCEFNAEPVLLTYKDTPEIDKIIYKYINQRSEYEFCTTHQIQHDLWIVKDESDIQALTLAFAKIDKVYIADGHHRTASSVLHAESKRMNQSNLNKEQNFNYFLSYLIAETKLNISEYNRAITHLNGLSESVFLERIAENFEIEESKNAFKPTQTHHFSLYLNKKWYLLKAKPTILNSPSLIEQLDSSILSNFILSPILGITDLKTDPNVIFIDGTKGFHALKKSVDSGKSKVAFGLYPVSVEQLKSIADANLVMPPKSTWIEPKMRNGLTIYDLKS